MTSTPKPARLRPFRQGGLDGLCSVYSVVNATRLAAWPALRLSGDPCNDLFRSLVAELEAHANLCEVLIAGSDERVVLGLLREADRWLRDRYGMRLKHHRPCRGEQPVDRTTLQRTLAGHLSVGHASAIVGLAGYLEHWSVVRAVTPTTLVLFDSIGVNQVPLKPTRRGHAVPAVGGQDLFLITCDGAIRAGRRAAGR